MAFHASEKWKYAAKKLVIMAKYTTKIMTNLYVCPCFIRRTLQLLHTRATHNLHILSTQKHATCHTAPFSTALMLYCSNLHLTAAAFCTALMLSCSNLHLTAAAVCVCPAPALHYTAVLLPLLLCQCNLHMFHKRLPHA